MAENHFPGDSGKLAPVSAGEGMADMKKIRRGKPFAKREAEGLKMRCPAQGRGGEGRKDGGGTFPIDEAESC
jgi:hypothetical protein